jgi:hypothetical protein
MKNSLFDLKTIVSEYKNRIPKPSEGKAVLYKFAVDNKLLNEEAPKPKREKKIKIVNDQEILKEHVDIEKDHKKMIKKVEKVEKELKEHEKKSPKKAKKMINKAVEMVEDKSKEVKPKSSALSKVQAIRKEKGVSLKEAWQLFKDE